MLRALAVSLEYWLCRVWRVPRLQICSETVALTKRSVVRILAGAPEPARPCVEDFGVKLLPLNPFCLPLAMGAKTSFFFLGDVEGA